MLGDRRKADDAWDFMLDHDKHIGYIRLTAFSRDTAAGPEEGAGRAARAKDCKGLILDLRFNPGGLLTSAIEVSDLFVAEGRIVSTKGRNTPERVWDAQKDGTFEGFPMVVLVNHYSASASEIVSACLQDHKRAVVIGERTWGKGSVQNVIELEDGKSALKLTTASYQRPSGKNIHRFPDAKDSDEWGVMPDNGFEVKLNDRRPSGLIDYRHERDILVGKHAKAVAIRPSRASRRATSSLTRSLNRPRRAAKPADASRRGRRRPAESAKPADAAKQATETKATTRPGVRRRAIAKGDRLSEPGTGPGPIALAATRPESSVGVPSPSAVLRLAAAFNGRRASSTLRDSPAHRLCR